MSGLKSLICVGFVSLSLLSHQGFAAQLSPSTEVQDNIKTLTETKSCPNCDLRGANMNRFDLSGANLEGANLSRANFSLSNFSGANLRNSDLRETIFNGADLEDADMRGADLTGTSLVGAYLKGALMDGEIVKTLPYAEHQEISELVEAVYVEDTVKPKTSQEPEEISIASRRDFEEAPPIVPEAPTVPPVAVVAVAKPSNDTNKAEQVITGPDVSIPQQSAAAPEVKKSPSIQEVNIDEQKKPVQEQTASIQPAQVDVLVEQPPQPPSTEGETSEVTKNESSTVQAPVEKEEHESLGMVDSAMGMVQSMFGGGGGGIQPQTETMMNVAILLDTNQCYGCNLDGAILTGEDLEDADLEGASLKGAKLSTADLENANLKGADLSDADLSGADLSGADLYRANLSGANLSNATLDGTELDEADLSAVKGYQKENIMLMQ